MEVGGADLSTAIDHAENGERATVALVNAKVATVDAKVDGLTDLIRAEFKDVQRQLAPIDALSSQVAGVHERQLLTEARLLVIEKDLEQTKSAAVARHRYRITDLPNILIGLGLFALAAVQAFH